MELEITDWPRAPRKMFDIVYFLIVSKLRKKKLTDTLVAL